MVTSPIGYLQDVLPQLSEHSKKWRKTLLDQVLLAPIFMLCLLIINSLLKNISTITGFSKENFNITVAVRPADTMNTEAILGYIFIIFALIYSVKITKKMSGVVAEYVNKVTGLAVTAAVVGLTAGAGAITAGGTALVSRGAVTAVGAGRLARAGRSLQYGAGVGMMKFGNVASGQAFKDAAGKPTALGVALTNAQKSVFGTVKKQTGVDLDSAIKYRENREKEYEKRYGEIANKIGGKKEIEELKVLNDISTNIKNQGESRARKEKKAEWDNVNNMPDIKDQEKKDKAEAKRKLQKETEDRGKQLAKAVAAEMGVDLAKHEAKKDELKITIERKTKDKNEYAANIPKRHKKIADRIRSQATYETKDKVEDDFIKMIKKIGFEKKGESTESKPKV